MDGLKISNLTITRAGQTVLNDLSLTIASGEALLLSGQNGAGKSTLALTLLGHSECRVDVGSIEFFGEDISVLPTFERARRGIFLAHQEPPAISGVTVSDVLRSAIESREGERFSYPAFNHELRVALEKLHLEYSFAKKEMHAQFSGGEKKKIELLSLLLLKPKLAILDEIDSGMDEEARGLLLIVIEELRTLGTAFLIISHHQETFENLTLKRGATLQKGTLL